MHHPRPSSTFSRIELRALVWQLREIVEFYHINHRRDRRKLTRDITWRQKHSQADRLLAKCEQFASHVSVHSSSVVRKDFWSEVIKTCRTIILAFHAVRSPHATIDRAPERVEPFISLEPHRKIYELDRFESDEEQVFGRNVRPSFVYGFSSWAQFLLSDAPGAAGLVVSQGMPEQKLHDTLQVLPFGGLRLWWEWASRLYYFADYLEELLAGEGKYTAIKPFPELSFVRTLHRGITRAVRMCSNRTMQIYNTTALTGDVGFETTRTLPQFLNEQLYQYETEDPSTRVRELRRHDTLKRGTFLYCIVQQCVAQLYVSTRSPPDQSTSREEMNDSPELQCFRIATRHVGVEDALLRILAFGDGLHAYPQRMRCAASQIGETKMLFDLRPLRRYMESYSFSLGHQDLGTTVKGSAHAEAEHGNAIEASGLFGEMDAFVRLQCALQVDAGEPCGSFIDVAVYHMVEEALFKGDFVHMDEEIDVTELDGIELLLKTK